MAPAASVARDHVRLVAVALGLLTFCALHAWRGYWVSDFWEHAAVVRELSLRPWSPKHPLLSVDATHAFFSPYLLAVALAARVTGVSPITALTVAGLVNIVLLVLAVRRFLVRLLPDGAAATPYALAFLVLLWGREAWMWSGFLHIHMLGFVAPYPATFTAAAMFLGLSLVLDVLDRGRSIMVVGIGFLVALCVITHPPTALVLLAGATALVLARTKDRIFTTNSALLAVAVAAGVAGASAWPYFPVLSLVPQPGRVNWYSGVFYQDVPAQVWPAILALPVLAWRLRQDRRDPLVLLVAVLIGIYAIGLVADQHALGRVIAYIVIFIHVALAAAVIRWEARLPARRAWLAPTCAVIVVVAFVAYNRAPLGRIARGAEPAWPGIARILAPVGPGDVVLTDSRTSYVVPALTGARVVGWRHPVYWIPDEMERRQALERFFVAAAPDERRAMIARYRVRWVLLDRRQLLLTPEEERHLLALGSVAAREESLLLLDVGRADPARGDATRAVSGGRSSGY